MNTIVVTLNLSEDDCLNMRLALNLTACEWASKAMEHEARGERDDYDTCQRLRAKYHALWERIHNAQREAEAAKAELARRERAADDMFASEARETVAPSDIDRWGAAMGIEAKVERDDDVIVAHGGASVWKAPRSGRDPTDVLNAIDSLKGW